MYLFYFNLIFTTDAPLNLNREQISQPRSIITENTGSYGHKVILGMYWVTANLDLNGWPGHMVIKDQSRVYCNAQQTPAALWN